MSVKEIGQSIKSRRKALRITQPDLAQLAKVGVNTLYKIERGQANPTIDIIEKITTVLGLEIKIGAKELTMYNQNNEKIAIE
ncbi:Helix-turn-helix [Chitinophaga sp. YR573]|uniref:helix-turn-helix domain-containing protein n=1 Tax=Chitinophaga sp. YR573 TaxID=1881040 RepID=UPI0008B62FBC|nr:helix-turn-helix domain-containing protein [Chitinophaga sp. YR573]SEW20486.1 Helix-turn-helix [Chitinophaga sp. YR573]